MTFGHIEHELIGPKLKANLTKKLGNVKPNNSFSKTNQSFEKTFSDIKSSKTFVAMFDQHRLIETNLIGQN